VNVAVNFTSNTGRIIETAADFEKIVRDLRNIVTTVERQSQTAATGMVVQGMPTFQRTIVRWNEEINELSGQLRNLSDRNQQVAEQHNNANNKTVDAVGHFKVI
jgi:uncharacterized protein YukE